MNMLFNKILGENEKGLSFILKNQKNFLAKHSKKPNESI